MKLLVLGLAVLVGAIFSSLEVCGLSAETGFESIFDGKTLDGWRADPKRGAEAWSVKDGVIRGEGKENALSYLVYAEDEKLADFELKFAYRMVTNGNTGVEVRSHKDTTGKRPFEGYHADLGHVGIGPQVLGAWDFHFAKRKEFPCKRGTSLVIDENEKGHFSKIKDGVQLKDIKKRDWNRCRIVAKGRHLEFYINDRLSAEFTDNVKDYLKAGSIGIQLHDKGMIVEFKDLELKKS